MIRALIVDDEYPAREELRYHLQNYPNIKIVGEAGRITEAVELIEAIQYDVIFLDINFPTDSGISLAMHLQKRKDPPYVIFITAYDEYAVQAFDVNAVDYILKPIDENKLKRSIEKVTALLEHTHALASDPLSTSILQSAKNDDVNPSTSLSGAKASGKISAFMNDKIVLVPSEEIYFAYVDTNYVFIKRHGDKLMTKYTLTRLEEKLLGLSFVRISRDHLVNVDKIKEISPFFNGRCTITMTDKEGSKLQVSRRQSSELKRIFDI
jgi:DNA-binding LytR/AlgR family response regulator